MVDVIWTAEDMEKVEQKPSEFCLEDVFYVDKKATGKSLTGVIFNNEGDQPVRVKIYSREGYLSDNMIVEINHG